MASRRHLLRTPPLSSPFPSSRETLTLVFSAVIADVGHRAPPMTPAFPSESKRGKAPPCHPLTSPPSPACWEARLRANWPPRTSSAHSERPHSPKVSRRISGTPPPTSSPFASSPPCERPPAVRRPYTVDHAHVTLCLPLRLPALALLPPHLARILRTCVAA